MTEQVSPPQQTETHWWIYRLALLSAVVYFFSNDNHYVPYDYTFRIAKALFQGQLGLSSKPPGWLNEFVPWNGKYYSVFPLGSVISQVPVTWLAQLSGISRYPSALVVAAVGALTSVFTFLLAGCYRVSTAQRVALALFVSFGTWTWCNLTFGGAWQIALGFCLCAQLAALYFLKARSHPFWIGLMFAIAYGNRTEVILTAPIYMWLLYRQDRQRWMYNLGYFCCAPLLLGLATLWYNYARFFSPLDFGYARIPGVLEEPWYKDGIFALSAIPRNFREMLVTPWRSVAGFPWFTPTGFGGSILISSPYLLLLVLRFPKQWGMYLLAWLAVVLLTLVLWCHGNPGGWQYSYRYAMVLIPWFIVMLLETSPEKLEYKDLSLLTASVLINGFGTYLFHWTDYVRP